MKRLCVVLVFALLAAGCSHGPSSATPSKDMAAGKPPARQSSSFTSSSEQIAATAQAAAAKEQGTARPVYPFSLVPGGVYSAEELQRALTVSKELRSHYSDFDFGHVVLVREKQDLPAYVSYRHNGQIFWTKRPLMVHAGELVLTDGHYTVRARCANQMSMVPREPVEVSPEKVENRLDTPAVEMPVDYAKLAPLNSALPPVTAALPVGPVLAGLPPTGVIVTGHSPMPPATGVPITPICTTCGSTPPTPPPVAVPEPSSVVLAGLSLALLGGILIGHQLRRRTAGRQ